MIFTGQFYFGVYEVRSADSHAPCLMTSALFRTHPSGSCSIHGQTEMGRNIPRALCQHCTFVSSTWHCTRAHHPFNMSPQPLVRSYQGGQPPVRSTLWNGRQPKKSKISTIAVFHLTNAAWETHNKKSRLFLPTHSIRRISTTHCLGWLLAPLRCASPLRATIHCCPLTRHWATNRSVLFILYHLRILLTDLVKRVPQCIL